MDWLLQIREALEKRVFDRACEVLGLEAGLLFFDITSTYFVTEEAGAPVARDEHGNPVPDGAESAAGTRETGFRTWGQVQLMTGARWWREFRPCRPGDECLGRRRTGTSHGGTLLAICGSRRRRGG